jgi:DNA-directed RNA polymerase subunit M
MSEVDEADIGPTTEARCPECGHDRARYEMKQIRAADESETRFFTCTECDHKWREDDH